MRGEFLFRSLRLRFALFVGVATSALAYYFAGAYSARSLEIKYKQVAYELRAATYDVIVFLRENPAPRPGTGPLGVSLDNTAFGVQKHADQFSWAFLDGTGEFQRGTALPGRGLREATRLEAPATAAVTLPGIIPALPAAQRDWPRSFDIQVGLPPDQPPGKRLMLARCRLPEGMVLLWFDLTSVDYRFGPRWKVRSARLILIYGTAAALGSWLLISLSLSPMRRIAHHAQQLSAKNLADRIATKSEPIEFEQLIRVLNAMLDRLDDSFKRVAGFSANASHELKTPLTILQGELELGLKRAPDHSEEQQRYLELLEEVYRLREITDTLLLLAQSDHGELVENWQAFSLSDTVVEVFEVAQQLDGDLAYESNCAEDVSMVGDRRLVHQLVMNLGTNAVRHNRRGGRVALRLTATATQARLRVENTGEAIPADAVTRIFDRFHRVDKARSRRTGGNGLGLNLAFEIAKAHGGELRLAENETDRVVFEVDLPLERKG